MRLKDIRLAPMRIGITNLLEIGGLFNGEVLMGCCGMIFCGVGVSKMLESRSFGVLLFSITIVYNKRLLTYQSSLSVHVLYVCSDKLQVVQSYQFGSPDGIQYAYVDMSEL